MSNRFALQQRVRGAVSERVTPGIAFGLSVAGEPPLTFYAGRVSHLPDAAPILPETPFDLASLTKPLTTTTWVLRLVSEGRLDLATPVGRFVEVESPELARAPVWRLLNHSSGLPAHREFFRGLLPRTLATGDFEGGRSAVFRMLERSPLVALPGEREIYSDLGFLLLERVAEAVDCPLAVMWPSLPFHGPRGLHLRPIGAPSVGQASSLCAATEVCPHRGRLIQGEVHDENAFTVGGVAGHAGLFGTLDSVLAYGEAVLGAWRGQSQALGIASEAVHLVPQARWLHPSGTHVLGWDTPSPGKSSAGRRFGPLTIGHLGFTGTSLWIDLEAEVVMALLTNRVCPTRSNSGIRALRPALHDAAWEVVDAMRRRETI